MIHILFRLPRQLRWLTLTALVSTTHDSPSGRWELFKRAPASALACVLREPYYGYVESTNAPLRRREYPGVQAVVIIELGPPLLLLDPHGASRGSRFERGFVAGIHRSYALTGHGGLARGIQVNLTPSGARRLLNLPMAHLTDRTVGLEELLLPAERELLARLVDAPGWEERFCWLDRLLLTLLMRSAPSDLGIQQAMRAIERAPSRLDVAALAHDLDCSPRHLIARFRDQVGAPPKLMARIARFEQALASLRNDPKVHFSELASRHGYSDHAHLVHDFRDLAGSTPSEVRVALASTGMPDEVRALRDART